MNSEEGQDRRELLLPPLTVLELQHTIEWFIEKWKTGMECMFRKCVFFSLLLAILFARSTVANPVVSSPSSEMLEAIKLGDAFLPSLKRKSRDMKLIEVKNVFGGKPNQWRLTYKERSSLPRETGGPGALGGELLIDVNLDEKISKFAGSGE